MGQNDRKTGRPVWTIPTLILLTVLMGGALSLFASANPDGLEWSIQKLTGSTELPGKETVVEKVQEYLAVLPDYGWKASGLPAGTTVSGIVGAALVLLFCIGVAKIFHSCRRPSDQKQDGGAYEQD